MFFPTFFGAFAGLVLLFVILYLIAMILAILVTLKSEAYSSTDKLIRVLLVLYTPFLGIILVFYEWKYGKI
ncbi:hypothetical protein [Aquirufa aurantiipilula]